MKGDTQGLDGDSGRIQRDRPRLLAILLGIRYLVLIVKYPCIWILALQKILNEIRFITNSAVDAPLQYYRYEYGVHFSPRRPTESKITVTNITDT